MNIMDFLRGLGLEYADNARRNAENKEFWDRGGMCVCGSKSIKDTSCKGYLCLHHVCKDCGKVYGSHKPKGLRD